MQERIVQSRAFKVSGNRFLDFGEYGLVNRLQERTMQESRRTDPSQCVQALKENGFLRRHVVHGRGRVVVIVATFAWIFITILILTFTSMK